MAENKCAEGVRPNVLGYEEIVRMVPSLKNHKKLVEWALNVLKIEEVNRVHRTWCHDTGVEFAHHLVDDEFKYRLRVDNEKILADFKEGPFITVSNHPYGGIDGIILIHLVGKYRPDYRVMVNMLLSNITAMGPSFIAVDPIKTDDPEKKRVTMQGIREAIAQVRGGHPLGFFPAGAVSKFDKHLHVTDREWQPTIIRLIDQLKVPVVPIYFHGHNGAFFNTLGLIDWRLRSMYLPRELFSMTGDEFHISVGDPISPSEQVACGSQEELGRMLRERTYALDKIK